MSPAGSTPEPKPIRRELVLEYPFGRRLFALKVASGLGLLAIATWLALAGHEVGFACGLAAGFICATSATWVWRTRLLRKALRQLVKTREYFEERKAASPTLIMILAALAAVSPLLLLPLNPPLVLGITVGGLAGFSLSDAAIYVMIRSLERGLGGRIVLVITELDEKGRYHLGLRLLRRGYMEHKLS